jgi:hypothetical protein
VAIPALMAASSSSVGLIVPALSFGIALDLSAVGLAKADDAPDVPTIRVVEKHYGHLTQSYKAKLVRDNMPTLGGTEDDNVVALSSART